MKKFRPAHAGVLRLLTLSSLLVALSGCLSGGSSPDVRFYTLSSMDHPGATQSLESTIGVGPILFPDYLKRPQIVTRSGANRMEIAEFDRWAEPLDAMFQRNLVANLDSLTPHHNVITYPFGSRVITTDYRVVGRVNRFEVDETGLVTLEVQWVFSAAAGGLKDAAERLKDAAGGSKDAAERSKDAAGTAKEVTVTSRHSNRAGTADGYAGIVAAMSEALESFSRELALYLSTAISQ